MAKWIWYKEDGGALKLKREGDSVDFGSVRKTIEGTYVTKTLESSGEYGAEWRAVQRLEESLTSSKCFAEGDVVERIKPPTLADVLRCGGYEIKSGHVKSKNSDSYALTLHEATEIVRICTEYFSKNKETATSEEWELWVK